MLRTFCLLLVGLSTGLLYAQDNIMDHPDISWIGEVYVDYRMTPADQQTDHPTDTERWNQLSILEVKSPLENSDFGIGLESMSEVWQSIIMEWISDPNRPVYKRSDLIKTLSDEERESWLVRTDTVVGLSPINPPEDPVYVVTTVLNPASIVGIRALHQVYYNEKKQAFGAKVKAYSPLVQRFDEYGVYLGYQSMFWLPASLRDQSTTSANSLSYVVQTKQHDNLPLLSDFETKKGSIDFVERLKLRLSNNHHLFNTDDGAPITPTEYQYLTEGVLDTVTIFDPNTFQETISIEQLPPAWEDFDGLRLVVRWYWIAELEQLEYELIGYAPMSSVKDDDGVLRYWKPLVYIKD